MLALKASQNVTRESNMTLECHNMPNNFAKKQDATLLYSRTNLNQLQLDSRWPCQAGSWPTIYDGPAVGIFYIQIMEK